MTVVRSVLETAMLYEALAELNKRNSFLCFPEKVGYGKTVEQVVLWIRNNPASYNIPDTKSVMYALTKHYGCKVE